MAEFCAVKMSVSVFRGKLAFYKKQKSILGEVAHVGPLYLRLPLP